MSGPSFCSKTPTAKRQQQNPESANPLPGCSQDVPGDHQRQRDEQEQRGQQRGDDGWHGLGGLLEEAEQVGQRHEHDPAQEGEGPAAGPAAPAAGPEAVTVGDVVVFGGLEGGADVGA